jgi:hypothetical protein
MKPTKNRGELRCSVKYKVDITISYQKVTCFRRYGFRIVHLVITTIAASLFCTKIHKQTNQWYICFSCLRKSNTILMSN